MTDSRLIIAHDLPPALEKELGQIACSSLFVITDSNVNRDILPSLRPVLQRLDAQILIIPAGEENKNLSSLSEIWRFLSDSGATRSSLIVNLGGGVVTDMGGFAAATFKRGIRYINIPTTVLGAVDAATGGKTAIDFNGLKNEIGAFHIPEKVILSPLPLLTLPPEEILGGYAELVKTFLISSEFFYNRSLVADPLSDPAENLFPLIVEAVRAKERITTEDPKETGLRKILNFGHTAGHAFETFMLRKGRPISHGEAVAHGILVALILSHTNAALPSVHIHTYDRNVLKRYYRPLPIECKDYDTLLEIMGHDKKNRRKGEILFVLLEAIGSPIIDCPVLETEIRAALDIYREINN